MTKYVIHPVSAEEKRVFGCKILDARFAPAGAEIFRADGTSTKPKKTTKKVPK
jgi:hypothetical protein